MFGSQCFTCFCYNFGRPARIRTLFCLQAIAMSETATAPWESENLLEYFRERIRHSGIRKTSFGKRAVGLSGGFIWGAQERIPWNPGLGFFACGEEFGTPCERCLGTLEQRMCLFFMRIARYCFLYRSGCLKLDVWGCRNKHFALNLLNFSHGRRHCVDFWFLAGRRDMFFHGYLGGP